MMRTRLEGALSSLPPKHWQVAQVVILDWYDGPRTGLCKMAKPQCTFHFALLDERLLPDDLDDRVFRLSEASEGTMEQMLSILGAMGPPKTPVWVPIWSFDSESHRLEAEQKLESVLASLVSTALIVQTPDMIHFLGFWTNEQAWSHSFEGSGSRRHHP